MVEVTDFSFVSGAIDGLCIATAKRVSDRRGAINELYRASAFADVEPGFAIAQLNLTETELGVVRGLHAEQMAKLVTLAYGEAFGVYVDLRPTSSTFGVVDTVALHPGVEVFVPNGVANGFQALSAPCLYLYCFDAEWRPGMPGASCTPLDAALGITWPIEIDPSDPHQLSEKDRNAPTLADIASSLKQ